MKTTKYYEQRGNQVWNFLMAGFGERGGLSAVKIDGKSIKIDDSRPITLARMREIYDRLSKEFEGKYINKIQINYSAYEFPYDPDDEGPNPQLWEKKITYNPKTNCMCIWEDGRYVYENNNGAITTDEVALADSLN